MRRTSGPALILAGAYLTGGLFLAHAAVVTVNAGGAPLTSGLLVATSGLSAVAAYSAATGPLARPDRPRPPTPEEAASLLSPPCRCDRWWTSFGTAHDTWCANYEFEGTT